MAILQSGGLSFEFCYANYEYEWVYYHYYFKWQGMPIVRDEPLKRQGDYWGARPKNAFLANEHESDSFVNFLKKVLGSNEDDYWEPIEPDIIVAVYSASYFPFLKPHGVLIRDSEEYKQQRDARSTLKAEHGSLDDDQFTIIILTSVYNFKGADVYCGEGVSLQLVVSRAKLKQFTAALEHEYQQFKQQFNISDSHE